MKNNNYALFYKTSKYSLWQSARPDLPVEEWENYAKEQGWTNFHISDFTTYDASQLHLTTNVVKFKGKYYLPEEEIPYPNYATRTLDEFTFTMEWEDEDDLWETDLDEIYNKIEQPWMDISVKFSANKKNRGVGIIPQYFIKDFPKFLEKLSRNNHAIYINEEFSPFKWLAWIKGNKVRLIQQNYCNQEVKTDFDVFVDKDRFFAACNEMLNDMQEYSKKYLNMYQEYALKKYGKLTKDSIPYPQSEPKKLGKIEFETKPYINKEEDFEELYKTKDEPWTSVYTYLSLGDKTEEIVLIAEDFVERFPFFLQELENIENAVYDDYKYTETKFHAWIKGDNVRLYYQDYSDNEQKVIFDILVDKHWFFETAEKLIKQMTELAESEEKRYKKYIKGKE